MALSVLGFRRVAWLAVVVLLWGCLPEDPILQPYRGLSPEPLADGWELSTPEAEGFDPVALEAVYLGLHASELWQLRSVLVFRNQRLVAESYLKDDNDLFAQRAIWSATKQVLAVLVGMAIDEGVLDGVDQPLGDCLEEIASRYPDKAAITLENLLEMRSGIAYSNDGASGQTSQMLRRLPADSASFILELPLNAEPGELSAYNDGNPHLLSVCMQRRTGEPLDRWAEHALFARIGFSNYTWRRYPDGTTLGGFGILTSPRELAKVAQLVANDGDWHGEQLVSAAWIADMTAPRVDSYDARYRFGYQWWFHERLGASYMNGHGGQYAFIDRDTATIVVITSEPNTQGDHQISEEQGAQIFEDVLATIRP